VKKSGAHVVADNVAIAVSATESAAVKTDGVVSGASGSAEIGFLTQSEVSRSTVQTN